MSGMPVTTFRSSRLSPLQPRRMKPHPKGYRSLASKVLSPQSYAVKNNIILIMRIVVMMKQ